MPEGRWAKCVSPARTLAFLLLLCHFLPVRGVETVGAKGKFHTHEIEVLPSSLFFFFGQTPGISLDQSLYFKVIENVLFPFRTFFTDITYPEVVSKDGRHLSHDLTRLWPRGPQGRRRRSLTTDDLHVRMSAFGQTYHLEMTPNRNLLPDNFLLEDDADGIPKQHLPRNLRECFVHGKVRGQHASTVALYLCGDTGLVRDEYFVNNFLKHFFTSEKYMLIA